LRRREGDPGEDRPQKHDAPGSGERAGREVSLEEGAMRDAFRRESDVPNLISI